MTSSIQKQPKSTVKITVEVPYDVYQKAEQYALQQFNENTQLRGFRSGHIPQDVLRQQIPAQRLLEQTLNILIPQTYSAALREHKIPAIAQPQIDIQQAVKKSGDSLIYVATVAVLPEVKMGSYKKLKVTRDPVKVTAKQMDEVLTEILGRLATFHPVDRPAKEGDRATLDFEGFDTAGKPIPNTQSKNHPLILGSKTFIPGFEEAVFGIKKGETKEFDIKFPAVYHETKLQGAQVKFKVTAQAIEERKIPLLDEAVIEKVMGKKMPEAAFKKQIEDDLKAEMELRARQDQEVKVIDEILKITQTELPESLIEEELRFMLDRQKEQIKRQGLTWEQYLGHIKKTEADFMKDNRARAEQNILARLGIQEIIKAEKITVTDQETEAEVATIVGRYPPSGQAKVRDYYKKGSSGYEQLRNQLAGDKVFALFI